MTADVCTVRPFAVGDRVLVWGVPAIVEHVARSLSNNQPVISVRICSRIRLRVGPGALVPAPPLGGPA